MTPSPSSGSVGRRLPRTFQAFRNINYRLLWTSNLLGYSSRWMQMILLAWFVLEATDSPWRVALVGFFGAAPLLALGTLGGVLTDRTDRLLVIRATQAANLLATAAMAAVLFAGAAQFWHAYLVIAVAGAGWAIDTPSRRSAIHDLLGRSGVTNGFALDSVGMSLSQMIGPALGGGLIALVGVRGGFVVVAALYLVTLALLLRIRLPSAVLSGKASVGRDVVEGVRYVAGHQALLAAVMVTIVMNLLLYPYMNMVPVIARDVLGVGPGPMGVLQALPGLSAVVGAFFVASLAYIRYHGRFYIGGALLALSGLLAFSFSQWYGASAAALLVLGLGTAGFSSMQATLVMLLAREDMRGKTLGIISLAIGTGPLGALLVGGMASSWGAALALRIDAVAGIVCLGVIAALLPALLRRVLPDEETVGPRLAQAARQAGRPRKSAAIPADSD